MKIDITEIPYYKWENGMRRFHSLAARRIRHRRKNQLRRIWGKGGLNDLPEQKWNWNKWRPLGKCSCGICSYERFLNGLNRRKLRRGAKKEIEQQLDEINTEPVEGN